MALRDTLQVVLRLRTKVTFMNCLCCQGVLLTVHFITYLLLTYLFLIHLILTYFPPAYLLYYLLLTYRLTCSSYVFFNQARLTKLNAELTENISWNPTIPYTKIWGRYTPTPKV